MNIVQCQTPQSSVDTALLDVEDACAGVRVAIARTKAWQASDEQMALRSAVFAWWRQQTRALDSRRARQAAAARVRWEHGVKEHWLFDLEKNWAQHVAKRRVALDRRDRNFAASEAEYNTALQALERERDRCEAACEALGDGYREAEEAAFDCLTAAVANYNATVAKEEARCKERLGSRCGDNGSPHCRVSSQEDVVWAVHGPPITAAAAELAAMIAPYWAEFERHRAPHLAAYDGAIMSYDHSSDEVDAVATYETAVAPFLAAYEEAVAPHLAAYEEAVTPLLWVLDQALAACSVALPPPPLSRSAVVSAGMEP